MHYAKHGRQSDFAKPTVKELGETSYEKCHMKMRRHTKERDKSSKDEIWLTSHPQVYTLGQSGNADHLLRDNGIPVLQSDRGGQITYHGPGQAIAYVLLDLVRAGYGVRTLVNRIEQATMDFLSLHGIEGARRKGMPGIYVGNAKIAALGLRVSRGCSYHGASLNVDLDLGPFADIDTCGYQDLEDTSMRKLGATVSFDAATRQWGRELANALAEPC